jgi:hypothetical protein
MRAIGRTLVDVERLITVEPDWFAGEYGQPDRFFAAASGPAELSFSGGLLHGLAAWPSEFSILVQDTAFADDPYAPRYRLSKTRQAPAWLRECLGEAVRDVRVYVYHDDVPSDEARQAGIGYRLESGQEIVYCIYLHGRMSGDEFVPSDAIDPASVAELVSLRERSWTS